MGFYLRKSVNVGPLRFNLSKGGIGISTGIKGLRIGTGPKGNYIHAGAGGFYYRTTLKPSKQNSRAPRNPPALPESNDEALREIDSDITLLFQDCSEDALVKDIVEKLSSVASWPWVLGAGFLLGISLDSLFFYIGCALAVAAYIWDETRRSVVLFYEFDLGHEKDYVEMIENFEALKKVRKVWHIEAQGNTSEWKKNAGANSLVRRNATTLSLNLPKFIKSNIPVPTIKVGTQTLCFLPDRLIILADKAAASVPYSDLSIEIGTTRFIETESVPSDADVIDHTWRFVNKSGGPDRRFKDNRQIPVCRYEEVSFHSKNGLNELIQISKVGSFENVRLNTKRLARHAS